MIFIFLFSILTLFGCDFESDKTSSSPENNAENSIEVHENSLKDEETPKKNIPSSETFTYKGQGFEVVYFYENYMNYLEKVKEQPANSDELFKEAVLNPLGGGDGKWILQQWGFQTPTRPALLEKYLQTLIEKQDIINNLIVEALKDSADQLQPGVSKYVYVLPANPDDAYTLKKVKGTAAITWNQNTMTIQIAPPFLEESNLKFAVAHEYHHTVFLEKNELRVDDTLLDSVLIEGKADTFARIIYPDIHTPWSDFSTRENEIQTWKVLQQNASSTDSLVKDSFFLGDGVKGLPKWANYKIGNKVMDNFIERNPDVSIADWTNLPSNEILEKSKYGEER